MERYCGNWLLMRSAALHKKIGLREDVLTASFVDLLRVHDQPHLVRAFLRIAAVVGEGGRRTGETLQARLVHVAWTGYELVLWPQWSVGEPDAVLTLLDGSTAVASIVIEAKAGASKSGTDEDGPVADPTGGDQLAVYLWEASKRAQANELVALVYLTHHAVPPHEELAASDTAARKRGLSEPIAWLAWHDVEEILSNQAQDNGSAFHRDVRDALALLRMYGYFRFRGRWRLSADGLEPARESAVWAATPSRRTQPTMPRCSSWRLAGEIRPAPGITFWVGHEPRRRSFRGSPESVAAVAARIFYKKERTSC